MDIRIYFQKIREVEASIHSEFVVVCSQETADGGCSGVLTEVPRFTAAKLIVEGRARLATNEQTVEFEDSKKQAKLKAEQAEAAGRLQFAVLSEQEARVLRTRQNN
ncbi:MAG TPA: hypothetical protein VEQ63_01560 [Bryobacteraceae bacterium]|nr:hypothetical protein [Bryobacteraceae bacterium]